MVPWPICTGVWFAGFVALLVSTLAGTRTTGGGTGIHEDHLVERMGAFTIIVCGEAFVKVAIAVSGSTVNEVDVVALFFQFVLTFAIWTSYFEDVPNAGIRPGWLRALARTAPRVAARDRRHRDRRGEVGEGRSARPRSVRGHPRDHRDARRRLPVARVDRRRAPGATPARNLLVLRLATTVVVVIVGVAAWQIDFVDLVEGVAALSVVAVLYAVASYRMTRRTEVAVEP